MGGRQIYSQEPRTSCMTPHTGGPEGLASAARTALATAAARAPGLLPAWVWRAMPRRAALALHRAQKRLLAAGGSEVGIVPRKFTSREGSCACCALRPPLQN